MPFTDEEPFLDAIFTRYHDDGPRLMYADFLDDSGEPERAELVRVQIALAKLPDDDHRRTELADRNAELHATHSAEWQEHLSHLIAAAEFRRGVLDSVSVDAEAFLTNGAELFRLARVRRLRLLDAAPVMEKLIESPLLALVRELDLCGNDLGNGGLNVLIRSPFLTHLDELDLGFNGLDDAGLEALAKASTLVNLSSLLLNDNAEITSHGVAELAESPFFAGLTTLDLCGNDINETGVLALTTKKAFPRLNTLRLKGNHFGDEGMAHLAHAALLERMLTHSPHLDLRQNGIGPDGVAALAECPALACCASLDLSANYLSDRGFAALIASPNIGNVCSLKLSGNQITDAGMSAVRGHLPELMARLRVLDLSDNRLTRYGIGVLHGARGDSGVHLKLTGNVQASDGGEVPVAIGDVTSAALRGMREAAEMRRRISHPRTLPNS
ncbi:MAG: TIGR02996 domain-containing protein [Planctomycetes bacterium]|nr:TIGR02996 domain-containing protein [Planctomycetota bacterium]